MGRTKIGKVRGSSYIHIWRKREPWLCSQTNSGLSVSSVISHVNLGKPCHLFEHQFPCLLTREYFMTTEFL